MFLEFSISYLSTVTTGPPPSAWCSSSATLTRSKTVESGEHCWGQLGLRKIQTSRGFPKEVEWEVETLNIRTLSITWRERKTFQSRIYRMNKRGPKDSLCIPKLLQRIGRVLSLCIYMMLLLIREKQTERWNKQNRQMKFQKDRLWADGAIKNKP